jgi:cobalamin biosynthesis protein CobD/CbiB
VLKSILVLLLNLLPFAIFIAIVIYSFMVSHKIPWVIIYVMLFIILPYKGLIDSFKDLLGEYRKIKEQSNDSQQI